MLRTAEQYREGLRDGRKVFLRGKPVEDVTEDPYIKVGVETAAHDFLMADDPEMREMAVMEDPENGELISTYFELPDYPEAIPRRFQLIKSACYYADGAIPFVKDIGTDILNALTLVTRLMGNSEYEERVAEYRGHCATSDLSMAGAVTDVKGDRSKPPHQQESPDYYLRVVDETPEEIVVSGAKAHITASAYTDEILVIPTRNMSEADADYAVAFAVPANSPGIIQVCRPSFPYHDKYHFPAAKPARGHVEALGIFDNVRVPKERVFMLRDWQFAQHLAYAFAAYHRYTAVTYKIPIIEHMTGAAMLAAEANGIQNKSHVREKYINMISYTETTKALAMAAGAQPEEFLGVGIFVPNRLISNMAKYHFASNFHEFIRDIQDIAGGLLVTQPTYQDWENSELRPYLERYMGGAGEFDAENRLKLMSALHHLVASDFAGWHEICTVHAEGSFAAQRMMILMEAPMEMYKESANRIIGLDL